MIATHAHAKALRYCNSGLRRWFEGRDVTYRDFLFSGVTVEWLRKQDDLMATRLADYVESLK